MGGHKVVLSDKAANENVLRLKKKRKGKEAR